MAKTPYRVVVWSTGGIGSIAINAIRERPDLQLVGVWVHSPDKVGRDAGELAQGPPIGINATNDKDALIALRPDCVVYVSNSPDREKSATDDYLRMLEAGINIVSSTSSRLHYPPAFDQPRLGQLSKAARAGKASLYASGIEPGFSADYLPLVLSTQSKSIRSVHGCELGIYDDYPVAYTMMDALGFGRPMEFKPGITTPGAIVHAWAPGVRMIADALGATIETFRETYDRRLTNRDINAACGVIKAGTCGAIRFQCIGVVDGKDAIIIEHVNRMARDVAPEWPIGRTDFAYRVEIKGQPNITCEMDLAVEDRKNAGIGKYEAGAGPMMSTAMRVVNAVPYVVDAKPGLVSALDLPLITPRHVLRP